MRICRKCGKSCSTAYIRKLPTKHGYRKFDITLCGLCNDNLDAILQRIVINTTLDYIEGYKDYLDHLKVLRIEWSSD